MAAQRAELLELCIPERSNVVNPPENSLALTPYHHNVPADEEVYGRGSRRLRPSIRYRHDAITRMRAHWLTHPEWVAASMSALAMYGCRYFVDEADTFVVRAERRRARTPLQVSSIGLDVSAGIDSASIETVLIDDITPGLRLLTPKLTLVTAVA